MRISSVLLVFLLFFIGACSIQHSTRAVDSTSKELRETKEQEEAQPVAVERTLVRFEPSSRMSSAMDKAESTGKMIFLDFFADYCPPCKLMDKEVFSDPEMADLLNNNFINVKVDAGQQEGANLASLFEIKALPTLIFTDKSGKVLIRKEGGTSLSQMQAMALDALKSTALK